MGGLFYVGVLLGLNPVKTKNKKKVHLNRSISQTFNEAGEILLEE